MNNGNEGGLPNRLGSAANQASQLASKTAQLMPFAYSSIKKVYGTITGVLNVEGSTDDLSSNCGVKQKMGLNFKIAVANIGGRVYEISNTI